MSEEGAGMCVLKVKVSLDKLARLSRNISLAQSIVLDASDQCLRSKMSVMCEV
jgi:hypothetical protein